MMRLPLAALAAFALAGAAHANLIVMLGSSTGGSAGMVVSPINTDLPEIVGLDTVGSTLTVKPGAWDGTPSTKTYNWHMIGGPSLGTGMTFGPLTSAMVSACSSGTDTTCGRLQVDEIATNAAGTATALSDYVGPVETALPAPPPVGPGTAPTSWPGPPANYLEDGWAVYPGCDVPPVAPDTSDPTKVWYFDPIAGGTQSSGATGHAGSPFHDLSAIFSAVVGYNPGIVTTIILQNHTSGPGGNQDLVQLRGTGMGGGIATVDGVLATFPPGQPTLGATIGSIIVPLGHTATVGNTVVYTPLWGSVITPGAVIYVKGDPSGASVGSIIASAYSTSDGTATGTVPGFWTWVLADPASTVPPILGRINLSSSAGFLFDGLHVEQNSLDTSTFATPTLNLLSVGGSIASPAFDVAFRNVSVTSWKGHSNDPKSPSAYPNTGGHADGTILTAAPYWGPGDGNVAGAITVTASAAGQTKLFVSSAPPNFNFAPGGQNYIYSPGYFLQQEEKTQIVLNPPSNTGIPNGTIIVDTQGRTDLVGGGTLSAATATELNGGVSPTITGTVTASSLLPAGTSGEFYIVASSPTTFSLLYGCNVGGGCAAGVTTGATGWTNLGSFLPATATTKADWFMQNTSHLWIGDATPSWVDSGQAYIDLAVCDPVVNAATGCPTTDYPGIAHGVGSNVPECDPKVGPVGGCGPSPVAWNGTTRALTAEGVFFSPRIQIIPAGWWNHADWNYALNGASLQGTMNTTSGNPDPANPNNIQGAYCLSISHSSVRWTRNEIGFAGVQDSIASRNFMKYRSGDAFKRYSSHRVMIIGNISADSSWQGRDHPDCIQDAQSFGSAGSHFYSNVDMDNECYTSVDPLDPLANYTDGIFGTDQIYDGSYKANNILFGSNSSSPLGTTGLWNVVVNNDAFSDFNATGSIRELSGSKSGAGQPAHTLIANNISNSLERNFPFPTLSCASQTDTINNNIMFPAMDWGSGAPSYGNSTHCNTNDRLVNASAPGAYPDFLGWVAYDWRTSVSGANSPFNDIHPNAPPALPGAGAGKLSSNSCLRNEWPVGTCNPGDTGRLDIRPSASFVPATGTIKGNVTNVITLPGSGVSSGDEYIVQSSVLCPGFGVTCVPGVTYPAGVYTYVGPGQADWTPQPPNPPVPYNPAIIGGGVNLGPQQPPTDHARRPWKATPSVGAYEAQ